MTKPKPDFTDEELLESLLQESNDLGPNDAWTMEELYQKSGIGRDRLRRKMHELKRAGKVEPVKVRRLNLGDDPQTVQGYRFKKDAQDT